MAKEVSIALMIYSEKYRSYYMAKKVLRVKWGSDTCSSAVSGMFGSILDSGRLSLATAINHDG